jgi:putative transcriptional regulator
MIDELTAPSFIIAMPQLTDPNFHRTVVLMVEHNEEGAFGLVINRPGRTRVSELCTNLKVDWGGEDAEISLSGGPVGTDQGFVLHGALADDQVVRSREVAPGIRMALDMESFRTLCTRPPGEFRMLLGYAGWGPGQLESEIRAGAWLTADVDPSLIFQTPLDDVWSYAMRSLGIDPAMLVIGGGVH